MKKFLISAAAGSLAVACASSGQQDGIQSDFNSAPPAICSEQLSFDEAISLVPTEPVSLTTGGTRLGNYSSCFPAPDGGRIPYAVFLLPRGDHVSSVMVGLRHERGWALEPEARVIRENGEVSRVLSGEDFHHRGVGLAALIRPYADEAYIVFTAGTSSAMQADADMSMAASETGDDSDGPKPGFDPTMTSAQLAAFATVFFNGPPPVLAAAEDG